MIFADTPKDFQRFVVHTVDHALWLQQRNPAGRTHTHRPPSNPIEPLSTLPVEAEAYTMLPRCPCAFPQSLKLSDTVEARGIRSGYVAFSLRIQSCAP